MYTGAIPCTARRVGEIVRKDVRRSSLCHLPARAHIVDSQVPTRGPSIEQVTTSPRCTLRGLPARVLPPNDGDGPADPKSLRNEGGRVRRSYATALNRPTTRRALPSATRPSRERPNDVESHLPGVMSDLLGR